MKSRQRAMKKGNVRTRMNRLVGQPVYVVLHDGRSYVGTVADLNKDRLVLAGAEIPRQMRSSARPRAKAKTSGLFAPLGAEAAADAAVGAEAGPAIAAAGAEAGGFGGFGGLIGMLGALKDVWPHITFGIKVVKTVMPLMKGLKL